MVECFHVFRVGLKYRIHNYYPILNPSIIVGSFGPLDGSSYSNPHGVHKALVAASIALFQVYFVPAARFTPNLSRLRVYRV